MCGEIENNCYIYKTRRFSRLQKEYLFTWFENESDFVTQYEKYKQCKSKSKSPYNDPDSVENGHVGNQYFYRNIALFLQKIRQDYWCIREPVGGKSPEDRTIHCCCKGSDYYLHTDQFGFSESVDNSGNKFRNPYYSYISNCRSDEKYKSVAKWLYNTRKIGGAFIWPKDSCGGAWKSMYNLYRGKDPIQDRVDMTLLEIKHYLDNKESINDYSKKHCNDKLHSEIMTEEHSMRSWLDLFDSFNHYVDLFRFHSFCVKKDGDPNYYPIDITKVKKQDFIITESDIIFSGNKENIVLESESCRIEDLGEKDIENMMETLCMLIDHRSKEMLKVINLKGSN